MKQQQVLQQKHINIFVVIRPFRMHKENFKKLNKIAY